MRPKSLYTIRIKSISKSSSNHKFKRGEFLYSILFGLSTSGDGAELYTSKLRANYDYQRLKKNFKDVEFEIVKFIEQS